MIPWNLKSHLIYFSLILFSAHTICLIEELNILVGLINFFKNVEIHIRSVFLQGLLLRRNNELPEKFLKYKKVWDNYHNWLAVNNINALEACINFILEKKEISKMVIGIETKSNLMKLYVSKKKKLTFLVEGNYRRRLN